MTTLNLATGEEWTYSSPVKEALIAANEQSRGNYNTWDYPKPEAVVFEEGAASVALGDWCVLVCGTTFTRKRNLGVQNESNKSKNRV